MTPQVMDRRTEVPDTANRPNPLTFTSRKHAMTALTQATARATASPAVPVFWSRWLIGGTVYTGLFGLAMLLWPSGIEAVFSLILFAETRTIGQMDPAALAYIRLLHGILGGVIFGWALAMLYWAMGPFRQGQREAWLALSWSVWGWFLTDTAYSLWSGFWQNALLNLGFAVLLGLPLLATRRCFPKA